MTDETYGNLVMSQNNDETCAKTLLDSPIIPKRGVGNNRLYLYPLQKPLKPQKVRRAEITKKAEITKIKKKLLGVILPIIHSLL